MGRQLQLAPSNGVRAGRQGGARGPFSCMPKNEAMPGAQGAATSRSLHTAPAETTGARLAAIARCADVQRFYIPAHGSILAPTVTREGVRGILRYVCCVYPGPSTKHLYKGL